MIKAVLFYETLMGLEKYSKFEDIILDKIDYRLGSATTVVVDYRPLEKFEEEVRKNLNNHYAIIPFVPNDTPDEKKIVEVLKRYFPGVYFLGQGGKVYRG